MNELKENISTSNNWLQWVISTEEQEITLEDEIEMWKQIKKSYLVEPKESSIIKSTILEKYINKLKEKELVYKECINCDSGMVLISESISILTEMEKELKLKINI
jgi:hypothetical protein